MNFKFLYKWFLFMPNEHFASQTRKEWRKEQELRKNGNRNKFFDKRVSLIETATILVARIEFWWNWNRFEARRARCRKCIWIKAFQNEREIKMQWIKQATGKFCYRNKNAVPSSSWDISQKTPRRPSMVSGFVGKHQSKSSPLMNIVETCLIAFVSI